MNNELAAALRRALPLGRVLENESLSGLTSFRVGGPAALIAEPASSGEVAAAINVLNEFSSPYLILGNGTNILAPDEGVAVPIIRIGKSMSAITRFENCVTAQAGAQLSAVARFAMENGLSGLEFASGIPGNVGGGVIMNAGAYGGELAGVVEAVSFVGPDGKEYAASKAEMEFGYRKSALADTGAVITGVCLSLTPDDKDEIAARMAELNRRRREKQPLEYPSAGSAFKRPSGGYAAALIDEAGLKGLAVGGAQVSEKHAGFVINRGGATAADVTALLARVQKAVYEKSGIALEPEIKIWQRGE